MGLESSPEQPQPLRVVTQQVKQWIERLGWVWVEGQLIEINRRARSATVFLTLRDKLAEVSVSVTTGPQVLDAAGPLTEGATVVAHLRPSYYNPAGRLSYHCDDIRPVGEGRLLAQLEQRKRMLQAEGLFDPRRKKPLPFLPRVVGLVTAAQSAAERDVVENARRRWPGVVFRTCHAQVQGVNAAAQVMDAVSTLDRDEEVDVIVVARGGGSIEDLLPFSDEGVLRTVAACRTPVVSAIGHESDSPILDLVADHRASTPTDAARAVVPDVAAETELVASARSRLGRALLHRLDAEQHRLAELRGRRVLTDPLAAFAVHSEQLEGWRHRLGRAVEQHLRHEATTVQHLVARARSLSPVATLERGYTVLADADGHTVSTTSRLSPQQAVTAWLRDGTAELTVHTVHPAAEEPATPTDPDPEEQP
ncbi:exodeoxyribonuclease VII large subunit [Desertihabitans brevis]|uniref:Exodeoxyribonuclease 7 large subunit n=1 Tax=Desertihabitans brevis TaxID=2268447 RepID=A0A367YS37_9ACTN|nr:exodeoxyribonuclease VII large subunit [Desertihabitans brevis]RCK68567.1 exodeoxyribonuclease VII large subunit [Desertihabitans brevis]